MTPLVSLVQTKSYSVSLTERLEALLLLLAMLVHQADPALAQLGPLRLWLKQRIHVQVWHDRDMRLQLCHAP